MQMSKSGLFMVNSSDEVFVNATDALAAQQLLTTATNDIYHTYHTSPMMIMGLTMGLAIGGNLLLIFVIIRSNTAVHCRITPIQMLILNTCTADLLYALITIMPTLINFATFPYFHGPNWLCKIVRYLENIPLYASSFLLVAISADRYQAICRPLASLKTGRYRRPAIYACIAWLLAFILSTPQLFVFEILFGDCLANYTDTYQHQTYAIGFVMAVWLLPSILAGTFYFCVCRAVWYSSLSHDVAARPRRNSSDKKQRAEERECYNSLRIPSAHSKQSSNSSDYVNKLRTSCTYRKQTNENERKRVHTIKLTLTIVACHFLLWSPFCIVNVIYALFPDFLSTQLMVYIMILGNINSCIDPWIYVLFNRAQVRQACCARKSVRASLLRAQERRAPAHHLAHGTQSDRAQLKLPLQHVGDELQLQHGHNYSSAAKQQKARAPAELIRATQTSRLSNNCIEQFKAGELQPGTEKSLMKAEEYLLTAKNAVQLAHEKLQTQTQ